VGYNDIMGYYIMVVQYILVQLGIWGLLVYLGGYYVSMVPGFRCRWCRSVRPTASVSTR
jgi:hypothetical protein